MLRQVLTAVAMAWMVACSQESKTQAAPDAAMSSKSLGTAQGLPDFTPPEPQAMPQVSVIDLLARPGQYDGKRVRLVGVLATETNGIFVSREHASLSVAEYGVALSTKKCDGGQLENPARFSDLAVDNLRYVQVEATFSTQIKGHIGEFRSGLCDPVRVHSAEIVSDQPGRQTQPGTY